MVVPEEGEEVRETEFHIGFWTDEESRAALVFQKGDGGVVGMMEAWSIYVNILGFGLDIGRLARPGEYISETRSYGFDWRDSGLSRYWRFEH